MVWVVRLKMVSTSNLTGTRPQRTWPPKYRTSNASWPLRTHSTKSKQAPQTAILCWPRNPTRMIAKSLTRTLWPLWSRARCQRIRPSLKSRCCSRARSTTASVTFMALAVQLTTRVSTRVQLDISRSSNLTQRDRISAPHRMRWLNRDRRRTQWSRTRTRTAWIPNSLYDLNN